MMNTNGVKNNQMASEDRTFRYYIIQINDPVLAERFSYQSPPSQIYAFTPDKTLAERFIQDRKENLFKLKKRDLSSYEAMALEKRYPLSYLVNFECHTRSDSLSTVFQSVSVVTTAYEQQNVLNTIGVMAYTHLVNDCYMGYKIFDNIAFLKSKYIKSLLDIGFAAIGKTGFIECGVGNTKIQYDTLEMLISLYSCLFR